MPRPIRALPLAAAVLLLSAAATAAPQRPRDVAFEAKVLEELRARAPDAVPLFEQANAAKDARDLPKATELYEAVLQRAPGFTHAQRRECMVLSDRGSRGTALPLCRAALAADPSAANASALAHVLIATSGSTPSDADVAEASGLARRATDAERDEPYVWWTLLETGAAANDREVMRRGVTELHRLIPDEPTPYIGDILLALTEGDEERARSALRAARAHGLPEAAESHFASMIEQATTRSPWIRAAILTGRLALGWLVVLLALLGVGYVLSRLTLRAVTRRPTEAQARPSELRLRRVYRALLGVTSGYYYASLPLLAVVVIAGTVGVIGGVLAAGWIAPKLFLIVGLIGFGSLVAIVKSVFVKVKDEDPGLTLDLEANTRLRGVLGEVAARVDTRPVDRVFLTPFTQVAVFDRGGVLAQVRGKSERCLVLGAGVLDGMSVRAFKSVLAHEYGHFRNEDTAGGELALAVRRSLGAMTLELIRSRLASPYNPAWWFVRGFWRAFLGISQGASRLQEVLADRCAAFAYGSRAFEEGLRHVIAREVRFGSHVKMTLDEVVKNKLALPNLYAFVPSTTTDEPALEREVAEALAKESSHFDSHPRPADRLAWVTALAVERPVTPEDEGEAWSLFEDRGAIEAKMTAEVRAKLQRATGVAVAQG
jgi:Zn-dependent protease with chaperone function